MMTLRDKANMGSGQAYWCISGEARWFLSPPFLFLLLVLVVAPFYNNPVVLQAQGRGVF